MFGIWYINDKQQNKVFFEKLIVTQLVKKLAAWAMWIRFTSIVTLCVKVFSNPIRSTYPAHSHLTGHINNRLLAVIFSAPCSLSLNVLISLTLRDQVSHPHKTHIELIRKQKQYEKKIRSERCLKMFWDVWVHFSVCCTVSTVAMSQEGKVSSFSRTVADPDEGGSTSFSEMLRRSYLFETVKSRQR
jgi:hypothetical protein